MRKVFTALAAVAAFVFATACFAEEYTLDKCLSIAQEKNIGIAQKTVELKKFEAKVGQAYSNLFPSVSLTSGLAYVIEPESMTVTIADPENPPFGRTMFVEYPDFGFMNQIDLQQILFSAQAFIGVKLAKIQRDVEQMNLEKERRDIKASVEQTFYGILMTQKAVDITRESHKQDEEHLKISREKFAKGMASEFEVLRAEVKATNTLSDLESALLANKLARGGMFLLLNLPFDENATFKGEFPEPGNFSPTLDSSLAFAHENRLELKILDRTIDVFSNLVGLYRSQLLPNIAAQGKFAFTTGSDEVGDFFKFDDYGKDWTVGVGLQWTLFDGLNRLQKISEAKSDLQNMKLTAEQARAGIDLEIRQNHWQLTQYKTDFESARASQQEAQKLMDIANIQFKEGLITFVELSDAQLAFDATQLKYFKALYNYNIALSNFKKIVGK